ncbi:MAG: alginate lyase family protein [Bryobacteraceae bacterium]|nr:alginate lyase family protein [Bryobacteraceae bacterium]
MHPATVTASRSPRSAGGTHDFFSEGDYWWPDPRNPDAPYLRRDGMTNPDNFVARRDALMRSSVEMPALTAAWMVTQGRSMPNTPRAICGPGSWMEPRE